MSYRIRITGYELVKASQLKANPENWRDHPEAQSSSLDKMLNSIGFVGAALARRQPDGTALLIDGHLRTALAEMHDDSQVPVLFTDLTDKEVREVLASYDIITGMAEPNLDKLRNLAMQPLDIPQSVYDLINFTIEVREKQDSADAVPADAIGGKSNPFMLKQTVKFPGENWYGIPDLLPEKLGRAPQGLQTWLGPMGVNPDVPAWFYVYKNINRRLLEPNKAWVASYTYDDKFEDLWTHTADVAEKMLAEKWLGIVAPNYSLWNDQPNVERLWQVYRSRWVSRYFQAVGFDVIPDINFIDVPSLDYVLLGLPDNLPCVSFEAQTGLKNDSEKVGRFNLFREVDARLHPEQVIIYGADPEDRSFYTRLFRPSVEVIHLESITRGLGKVLKASAKAKKNKSG